MLAFKAEKESHLPFERICRIVQNKPDVLRCPGIVLVQPQVEEWIVHDHRRTAGSLGPAEVVRDHAVPAVARPNAVGDEAVPLVVEHHLKVASEHADTEHFLQGQHVVSLMARYLNRTEQTSRNGHY